MIHVNPRRPFMDDQPDGLLESDRDFVANNFDAAVTLLERELKVNRQQALQNVIARIQQTAEEQHEEVRVHPDLTFTEKTLINIGADRLARRLIRLLKEAHEHTK